MKNWQKQTLIAVCAALVTGVGFFSYTKYAEAEELKRAAYIKAVYGNTDPAQIERDYQASRKKQAASYVEIPKDEVPKSTYKEYEEKTPTISSQDVQTNKEFKNPRKYLLLYASNKKTNILFEESITVAFENNAQYVSYNNIVFKFIYKNKFGEEIGTETKTFYDVVLSGETVRQKYSVNFPKGTSSYRAELISSETFLTHQAKAY